MTDEDTKQIKEPQWYSCRRTNNLKEFLETINEENETAKRNAIQNGWDGVHYQKIVGVAYDPTFNEFYVIIEHAGEW
jgi:hypothetical protein